MIKTLSKVGVEGVYLNLIKAIHEKPTVNITLSGQTLKVFPLRSRTRQVDLEDGGNIGGSGIHFPSAPGKYLADLRSRANSQQYSSIYED